MTGRAHALPKHDWYALVVLGLLCKSSGDLSQQLLLPQRVPGNR